MSLKRKGMSLPSGSAMGKQWTMLRLRIKGRAAQNGNVRSDAPDRVSRGDFFCNALSRGFRGVSISLIASAGLRAGRSKREAADARA